MSKTRETSRVATSKQRTKITPSTKKKDITIAEGFRTFIKTKETENKSQTTINAYHDTIKNFYFFIGHETLVKDINEETIQDWIAELKLRTLRDGSPIKATSINHNIRNIRAILYFLMSRKHLEHFEIRQLTTQEPEPKAWSKQEAEKLLRRPQGNDFGEWRTHCIATMICGTGIRSGSIRAILMQDLDLHNNTLILRHTKNNKLQVLNIPPTLAKTLKTYIEIWRDDAADEDYLFPNRYNEELTKNAIIQSFARYARNRGINNTSLHSGRHYFGLNFILSGGDALSLQHILGHSDLSTTKKYVALNHENIKPQFLLHNPLEQLTSAKSRKQVVKNSRKN